MNKLRELFDPNSDKNKKLRRTLRRYKHQMLFSKACIYCVNALVTSDPCGVSVECKLHLTEGTCGKWERKVVSK